MSFFDGFESDSGAYYKLPSDFQKYNKHSNFCRWYEAAFPEVLDPEYIAERMARSGRIIEAARFMTAHGMTCLMQWKHEDRPKESRQQRIERLRYNASKNYCEMFEAQHPDVLTEEYARIMRKNQLRRTKSCLRTEGDGGSYV